MKKSILLLTVILKRGLASASVRVTDFSTSLYVKKHRVLNVLFYLKGAQAFKYNLVDKFAIQFSKRAAISPNSPHIAIAHQLESHVHPSNLRIISLAHFDKTTLQLWAHSTQVVWASSGWAEREIYDMHGIYFYGNVDLRRILTDYGFKEHPLRKEFPAKGISEFVTVKSTLPAVNA